MPVGLLLLQYSNNLDEVLLTKDSTMEELKATFAQCKKEARSALVTYVTAGYPTAEETPDIMLGMEAGGAGTSIDRGYEKSYLTVSSKT